MPAEKRGWPDWVKGIALYGLRPDGTLGLIMTDEAGNLRVVHMPHAFTHEDGGSDEINVQGLSGVLKDLQNAKFSYVGPRATFPTGLEAGALAYAVDEKALYRWDGSAWVKILGGTFISLLDTPESYSGFAGYYPRVKATEDGLEFVAEARPGPHAEDHRKDGVDPLPTAAPAAITEGATSSEGTSPVFARADHIHGTPSEWTPKPHASTHRKDGSDPLPTGTPAAITEGASSQEGTSAVFARADHIHGSPSEWTPKVHGNERHSPEFLARDGSNTMLGELRGTTSPHFYGLRGFYIPTDYYAPALIEAVRYNRMAFLTLLGGTVTFNPSPTSGTAADLFDGRAVTYVYWANPSGDIVVEITFPGTWTWMSEFFIQFVSNYFATSFKVEWFRTDTNEWETKLDITDWNRNYFCATLNNGSIPVSKLRITFRAYNSPSYLHIAEIGWTYYQGSPFPHYLSRSGDKMLGDLDMGGKSVNNPNLVDGVDVSAHASRHRKDGADPLPTGTPISITEGASSAEGTSAVFARADHRHGTPSEWTPKVHGNEKHSPSTFAALVWRVPSGADWSGTSPTSWTTLDLSGIVGARRALVCITVYNGGSLDNNYVFRSPERNRPDSTLYADTHPGITKCRVSAGKSESILIWTNTSGRVQWWSERAYTTNLYIEWFMYVP